MKESVAEISFKRISD